jgi:hypothetical protein
MADDLRRRNSHLGMCKCRKSTTLQTQKQQRSPQVQQQGNRCQSKVHNPMLTKARTERCTARSAEVQHTRPKQGSSHCQAQYQYKNGRIFNRNTSTRIVASSSAIPVRAFPKRSERHTAPMSPAHTGRRRHNAQGERQAKEATQAGAELQAGGAQERAQIESTVNLLRPDYHHRPRVTSNRTLRT